MEHRLYADLNHAIQECSRHTDCLKRSLTLLAFFPLSEVKYKNLSDEEIEHIDQMIYRFMKLQDTMGRKLFPALFGLLEPEKTEIPFIDKLNTLEKLGIIESCDAWLEKRALRNNLAHEYPDRESETVLALNTLWTELPDFLKIFEQVHKYAEKRNFLS